MLDDLKEGKKTSEFLLTVAFVLIVALNHKMGLQLGEAELAMIGGLCGVYSGGRAWAKAKQVQKPKETIVWKEKPDKPQE